MSKRAWGRIALVAGSLTLGLGAAEAVYRSTEQAHPHGDDSEWRARYDRLNQTLYRRSDDPVLIYEPRHSSRVPMEYGDAFFDEHGMRDDRPHALTRDDRIRVALVGDSIVWSEFMALESSLPRRVQDALGDRYEVLPFGVTGYDSVQEARWYQHAVRAFHPQIVVLVYCMNDMLIMSGPFEHWANDGERQRKHQQDHYLDQVAPVRRETIDSVLAERERNSTLRILARGLGIFERWRFDRHYDDEYLAVLRDRTRVARTTAAISGFGRAVTADQAQGLLVISPVLEAWNDYHWNEIHRVVRDAASHANLRVVDPLPVWQRARRPEDLRISGDNLHYGEEGNRAFARVIAAAISSRSP